MRIGFLGKGGSGKTSVIAGFTRWLESNGARVVAIDGDVNAHLHQPLGIQATVPDIGSHFDEIALYVRGERTDLGDRPLISSTPPSPYSRFITCDPTDPFLQRYAITRGSLSFLRVGGFSSNDVGASCYHTKLQSLSVILNHLVDATDEYVLVDATAGVDTLSTSLVTAYDVNIFVVEPTLKSINVCKDYVAADPQSVCRTIALVNKGLTEADSEFVRSHLGPVPVIGCVSHSESLHRYEQGETDGFESFVREHSAVWTLVREECSRRQRPWGTFQQRLHEIHKRNCETWYNSYYKQNLHFGLDEPFVLPDAQQERCGAGGGQRT